MLRQNVLGFLVSGSVLYITVLPISPVYVAFLLSSIFVLIYYFQAGFGLQLYIIRILLFVSFSCVVILAHGLYFSEGRWVWGSAINFIMCPLIYAVAVTMGRGLERSTLTSLSRLYVFSSVVLFSVEALIRLLNPDVQYLDMVISNGEFYKWFYAFKSNSIMYMDSNFVGLQQVILVSFMVSFRYFGVRFHSFLWFVVIILLLLSFSRASYVALASVILVHMAMISRFRILIIPSILMAATVFAIILISDSSFLSKFEIIDLFINYLRSASPYQIVFGNGFGSAEAFIGMGAHNIVVAYILEAGVLLSAFIVIFWIGVVVRSKPAFFLVLAWVVNGMSLTTFAVAYLYAAAALLVLFSQNTNIASAQPAKSASPMVRVAT